MNVSQIIYEQRWDFYILGLLMLILVIIAPASAFSGSGAGTVGDPYQITTTAQWSEIASSPSSAYILENDLNFAGVSYAGLDCTFTGVLNGNNKTVRNMVSPYGETGSITTNHVTGMFPSVDGGTVENIYVTNLTLTNTGTYSYNCIGGIAGESRGATFRNIMIDFSDLTTTLTPSSTCDVGGITGYEYTSSTIDHCIVIADVFSGTNVRSVGGMVGWNGGGETYCFAALTPSSTLPSDAHGINGNIASSASNCYYDYTVFGTHDETGATKLTTAQCGVKGNFASWTSSWFFIGNGYPAWVDYFPPPVASFTFAPSYLYYADDELTVTDTSTGTPTSWQWSWGDGSPNSTTQNPSHTYSYDFADHTYTVTLTATNAMGSSTTSHTVTYYTAPQIGFGSLPSTGYAPLSVTFTGFVTVGDVTSYDWNFGDGSTHATTQNATHSYAAAGNYTVTYTVTGKGGTTVLAVPSLIVVSPAVPYPSAMFTATPVSANAPVSVTFADGSGGNVTSWLWDFGDGHTSSYQNPTHTYSVAGNYTVTLTVAGALGNDTLSRPSYIHILPASTPTPTPTITPVPTVTPNASVTSPVFYWANSTIPLGVQLYPSTMHTVLTPVQAWLGDRAIVRTDTVGISSVSSYDVDGWRLVIYKQKPELPGEYTPEVITVPKNADTYTNITLNTTDYMPDDMNYGTASYPIYLFAYNSTIGDLGYGNGLIYVANTAVTVEFAQPEVEWSWANMNRNPLTGETVTAKYWLNSFYGLAGQDDYRFYLERSLDGGATWSAVPIYNPLVITADGSQAMTPASAEKLRARVAAGNLFMGVYTSPISSYWYSVTVDTPSVLPSFVWKNSGGNTVTSVSDTELVKFGLDTGTANQNQNYPKLQLYFQKYNKATQQWDTLPSTVSGFLTSPSDTLGYEKTWGQQRLTGYGSFYANSLYPSDPTGKYRAVMMAGNTVIKVSSELTVSQNLINPVNVANNVGGFMGLGATGGVGTILFGTIITIVISIVAFFLVRDARVFLVGALLGVGVSYALGLFPLWLIIIAGIAGVAALLFGTGILGGKGEGGSPPQEA